MLPFDETAHAQRLDNLPAGTQERIGAAGIPTLQGGPVPKRIGPTQRLRHNFPERANAGKICRRTVGNSSLSLLTANFLLALGFFPFQVRARFHLDRGSGSLWHLVGGRWGGRAQVAIPEKQSLQRERPRGRRKGGAPRGRRVSTARHPPPRHSPPRTLRSAQTKNTAV